MVSFVDEHRTVWPVAVMCRTIGLPERTYHAAKVRPPSKRSFSDEVHKVQIGRVWATNYSCYGPRRVYKQLRREGYVIARCTVTRIMADIGLRGVQRGKKHLTTFPDDTAARPADLVERQFRAERPNQLWVADITYVSTWQGWLYAAFILDAHSRMIVGWQLASHLRTDLVLDALEMALWRSGLTFGELVHHSDRGTQYTSYRYSQRLADAEVAASVGSRGDSYDNAMAESLNGTFKAELIHLHGPWRTRDQAEMAIIECTAKSATSHPPSTKPTGTVTTTRQQPLSPPKPRCTRPGLAHVGSVVLGGATRCALRVSGRRRRDGTGPMMSGAPRRTRQPLSSSRFRHAASSSHSSTAFVSAVCGGVRRRDGLGDESGDLIEPNALRLEHIERL
jgi:putative transposase